MIKSDSKDINNITKKIYFKLYLFERYIYQTVLKKKTVSTKWLITKTGCNTDDDDNNNNFWAANQHIKMISEGSCDSEH